MKRTTTIVALAVLALVAANASAQTNDHFARQRQEAVARQAAAQHHLNHGHHSGHHYDVPNHHSGHWGGATTTNRFYHPSHRQSIQFYSVSPYGYGFGYGVPGYGYSGGGYPYYGAPYYAPGGTGIYIHREIYLER